MTFIYLPHKIFVIFKRRNSNFTVAKPGRHHFSHVIRVNIASSRTAISHTPIYDTLRRASLPWVLAKNV